MKSVRQDARSNRYFVLQDLSKLGRDLDQVVIVDNSPHSYIFHPENAVSDDFKLLRTCISTSFLYSNI